MVPGNPDWPAASAAGVVDFVETHVDPAALGGFRAAREAADGRTGEEAIAHLAENAPELFALVMVYAYTGYYGAPEVIEVIRAKGSDFHGAPQPAGYRIPEPSPVPTEPRGSFIATEEVTHVG